MKICVEESSTPLRQLACSVADVRKSLFQAIFKCDSKPMKSSTAAREPGLEDFFYKFSWWFHDGKKGRSRGLPASAAKQMISHSFRDLNKTKLKDDKSINRFFRLLWLSLNYMSQCFDTAMHEIFKILNAQGVFTAPGDEDRFRNVFTSQDWFGGVPAMLWTGFASEDGCNQKVTSRNPPPVLQLIDIRTQFSDGKPVDRRLVWETCSLYTSANESERMRSRKKIDKPPPKHDLEGHKSEMQNGCGLDSDDESWEDSENVKKRGSSEDTKDLDKEESSEDSEDPSEYDSPARVSTNTLRKRLISFLRRELSSDEYVVYKATKKYISTFSLETIEYNRKENWDSILRIINAKQCLFSNKEQIRDYFRKRFKPRLVKLLKEFRWKVRNGGRRR